MIAEAELELAMSKLKLSNKKNPQKIIEEIASCEVKYGIPVSDSKKVAQMIRLGGKKYGTVITVTQMGKKTEGVTCTSKHIVDEMWKQWQVKGGKERGEENSDVEEETSLAKTDANSKGKKKGDKDKDIDPKKKETHTCNHCAPPPLTSSHKQVVSDNVEAPPHHCESRGWNQQCRGAIVCAGAVDVLV